MTRHGPLTIHPVATLLRETTPAVPRGRGMTENLSNATRSPQSDRPVRCGQSSTGPDRTHLSDHRTVPNHQPNPQSP
jgi:hypothetical protein